MAPVFLDFDNNIIVKCSNNLADKVYMNIIDQE